MSIKLWNEDERPREKLLIKGSQTLSDAELLAILWRTGVRGKTAVDLARELLTKYSNLRKLAEANQKELCKNSGIGSTKYVMLQAALEISRRLLYNSLDERKKLSNTIDTQYYLRAKLRHQQQEVFAGVFLDNKHRIICYEELFYGTVNQASIYPREIVKRALYHNAAAIILAHNHPSGAAEPSTADQQITNYLTKSLALIEVRVLDHIIIGENLAYSMLENGLLKP